jgi:hypothetical protein
MDGQRLRRASILLPIRAASNTSLPGSSVSGNKPREVAAVTPKSIQASHASSGAIPIKKITDLK